MTTHTPRCLRQDNSGQWGTFSINNVWPAPGTAEYAHIVARPAMLADVSIGERVRFEAGYDRRMKGIGTVADRQPWKDGWERLRLANVIVEGKA